MTMRARVLSESEREVCGCRPGAEWCVGVVGESGHVSAWCAVEQTSGGGWRLRELCPSGPSEETWRHLVDGIVTLDPHTSHIDAIVAPPARHRPDPVGLARLGFRPAVSSAGPILRFDIRATAPQRSPIRWLARRVAALWARPVAAQRTRS